MSLTITGTLIDVTNTAYDSATITVRNLTPAASNASGSILWREVTATTDENGDFSIELQTPTDADEAFLTEWVLPDGQTFRYEASTASNTTLAAIWAAAVGSETTSSINALSALIDAHNSVTTSVHGISDTSALVTTSNYTAADVLTKLLTVDGTGSGLDADLLDGNEATAFELALGNPGTDGYVLSSTTGGTRSWVEAGGGGDLDSLSDVTLTALGDDEILLSSSGTFINQTFAEAGIVPVTGGTFTGNVAFDGDITADDAAATHTIGPLTLDAPTDGAEFAGSVLFPEGEFNTDYPVIANADRTSLGLQWEGANLRIVETAPPSQTFLTQWSSGLMAMGGDIVIGWKGSNTAPSGAVRRGIGPLLDEQGIIVRAVSQADTRQQAFFVSNSYTDEDNLEVGAMTWNETDDELQIGALARGTGTERGVRLIGASLAIDPIVNFTATMGNSTLDPTTDAPADWVEIEIGGTTYYVPAYAAS